MGKSVKADGFGVGLVLRLDKLGSPGLHLLTSGFSSILRGGPLFVKAGSLQQLCAATAGIQPRSTGRMMKSHQSHRAGPGS